MSVVVTDEYKTFFKEIKERIYKAQLSDNRKRRKQMQKKVLTILLWCVFIVSMPTQSRCEEVQYREGIFQVSLSKAWTRMPQGMLDEMKKTMITGGRELATASKSADPNDINQASIPFVSGFQLQDGSKRILMPLSGVTSPIAMDIEDMYKTNSERTKWGIDTGRLKKTSKGVSKLTIDGVPCLLMDIETDSGGRMQMYSLFLSEYPKMTYSFQFICDDIAICNKHGAELSSIVKSIKVVRKAKK